MKSPQLSHISCSSSSLIIIGSLTAFPHYRYHVLSPPPPHSYSLLIVLPSQLHFACSSPTATRCLFSPHSYTLLVLLPQLHVACSFSTATRCLFFPHSYTLLVGKPPFETSCLKDTYTRIKMNEYHIPSTRVSASARCLIKRLLQASPTSRPNMTQILEHDFLTSGQSFLSSSSLVLLFTMIIDYSVNIYNLEQLQVFFSCESENVQDFIAVLLNIY